MGLLLSVLVACVGVIELIAFFQNVKRHLVSPPVCADLTPIGQRYVGDLERLQDASSSVPTLRLNSHEDIELEYSEDVRRSRSPSPRKFLVTEKEVDTRGDSPRRFVVSGEPGAIRKSKSQESIPEFLIREEQDLLKSPHKPRYVLREQQRRSDESPIPLPRQFIVTEDELNTVVFEETDFEVSSPNQGRAASPYPPLELPHVPRNSVCEVTDIAEEDEDICRSISPSPSGKIDVILRSASHNTTEFWTNKVLVQPPGEGKSKSKVQRLRSKSESANDSCAVVDEQYLNSLDGVEKVKIAPRYGGSRRSFKKKNGTEGNTSKIQDSCGEQSTTAVLTHAAEELRKVSLSGDKSALEYNEGPERKPGEPFWVKK